MKIYEKYDPKLKTRIVIRSTDRRRYRFEWEVQQLFVYANDATEWAAVSHRLDILDEADYGWGRAKSEFKAELAARYFLARREAEANVTERIESRDIVIGL